MKVLLRSRFIPWHNRSHFVVEFDWQDALEENRPLLPNSDVVAEVAIAFTHIRVSCQIVL
jgi:hypothetical protein